MKKYLAELVGTFVLTLFGCGTAVSLNCGVDTASVVGTALAFGIAVVAMAYAIGGISGCHINPAITIGCLLSGRISGKDAAGYIVAQVIGAIVASSVLYLMVSTAEVAPAGTATGANACNLGIANGFIVQEINEQKVNSQSDVESIYNAIMRDSSADKVMYIKGLLPTGRRTYLAIPLLDEDN